MVHSFWCVGLFNSFSKTSLWECLSDSAPSAGVFYVHPLL